MPIGVHCGEDKKNELQNYLNHAGTFWDQKFGLKLKHIKAKCVLSFPLANNVIIAVAVFAVTVTRFASSLI